MPRKLSHLQAVLVAEAPHRLYLDGAGGLVLPHRECLRPNQLEHPVSPQNLLEQKSCLASFSPLYPLAAPCSRSLSHAQTRSHGSHRQGEPRNVSGRWNISAYPTSQTATRSEPADIPVASCMSLFNPETPGRASRWHLVTEVRILK